MIKFLFLLAFAHSALALSSSNLRSKDPVVLKGSDIPELVNEGITDLDSVVGFAYDSTSSQFTQIPIQIDEMHMVQWQNINPFNCRSVYSLGNRVLLAESLYTFGGNCFFC